MPIGNAKTDTEQFADLDGTVAGVTGWRHQPARHHGFLPQRPYDPALASSCIPIHFDAVS
jgi:hypothetical protein